MSARAVTLEAGSRWAGRVERLKIGVGQHEAEEWVVAKSTEAVSARARARRAKAELDVQRAAQDRLIVDTTTEFYEAVEALAAAQAAAAAAEQQRVESVSRLVELGQTEQQIATLCGVTTREVRDLRRLGAGSASRAPSTAAAAESPAAADGEGSSAAVAGDGPEAERATAAA